MRGSLLGRLAVPVLVFIACGVVLGVMGASNVGFWAFGITLVIELALFVFRRHRKRRKAQAVQDLQAELHKLKQEEFALRYAEAQQNGDLKWDRDPS